MLENGKKEDYFRSSQASFSAALPTQGDANVASLSLSGSGQDEKFAGLTKHLDLGRRGENCNPLDLDLTPGTSAFKVTNALTIWPVQPLDTGQGHSPV